jgi:hypothetical protein
MPHTLETAAPQVNRLRQLLATADRSPDGFQITVSAFETPPDQVADFEQLGVHRLIVRPAVRSSRAVDQLAEFATRYGISGEERASGKA